LVFQANDLFPYLSTQKADLELLRGHHGNWEERRRSRRDRMIWIRRACPRLYDDLDRQASLKAVRFCRRKNKITRSNIGRSRHYESYGAPGAGFQPVWE